jgi:hypothetical protein
MRPFLVGHTVETAVRRGWDKFKNGELLEAAEQSGFEVLVTPDKNIRYQIFEGTPFFRGISRALQEPARLPGGRSNAFRIPTSVPTVTREMLSRRSNKPRIHFSLESRENLNRRVPSCSPFAMKRSRSVLRSFSITASRQTCNSRKSVKPGIKAQDSLDSMVLHDRQVHCITG